MANRLTTSYRSDRRWALAEATAQTGIGLGVSYATTLLVLPLFGFAVSEIAAVQIVLIYTALSFARQYAVRRIFQQIGKSKGQ